MSINNLIRFALIEDLGSGDITTEALIPNGVSKAAIVAKEDGLLSGAALAREVFKTIDRRLEYKIVAGEGAKVRRGDAVAIIKGEARSILKGERVALNFLSHLSGIATLTSKFVKKVKGAKSHIYDTRKTLPGLREPEKYAVRAGGGRNHRLGLYDQVLIKDNHLKLVDGRWFMVYSKIEKLKRKKIKTEIEVKNLKEFKKAIKINPDIIMLDNMSLKKIMKAVKLRGLLSTINHKLSTKLEVSGNVNLNNVRAIAKTGVDRISVGAITHSAPALDFSLEIINK